MPRKGPDLGRASAEHLTEDNLKPSRRVIKMKRLVKMKTWPTKSLTTSHKIDKEPDPERFGQYVPTAGVQP